VFGHEKVWENAMGKNSRVGRKGRVEKEFVNEDKIELLKDWCFHGLLVDREQ
jgi:hypothetical protein